MQSDPEIAEALALARQDPELTRWLVEHCARQEAAARRITASHRSRRVEGANRVRTGRPGKNRLRRQRAVLALAVVAAVVVILSPLWFQRRASNTSNDTFAMLQKQMASVALRGYGMDLTTNNPASVRAYLAQNHAPGGLRPAGPVGKNRRGRLRDSRLAGDEGFDGVFPQRQTAAAGTAKRPLAFCG